MRKIQKAKLVNGYLLPHEAREEWHPSGWHSYKGIREELEKTELE